MTFPWNDSKRFNSYSAYMKLRFGERVQKLSINAGFTCPNRDGSKGTGGCTYCNNHAFNPSYCSPDKSIKQQIEEGIEFHQRRYRRANSYIAYFQAYSNTYDSVSNLEGIYGQALDCDGVIGMVIGTRPDCIDDDKLDLLKDIAKSYYVAVEYGVESCNNNTLMRINRGHGYEESVEAITKTAACNIDTCAHFIFGLPGESRTEMMSWAEKISSLPLTSLKFHQLQIIRNTAMEDEYINHPADFEIFSYEDYLDFFVAFIERLNPSMVVERFTSEAPPHLVVSPNWGKKRNDIVMRDFEQRLEDRNTWQGRLYK